MTRVRRAALPAAAVISILLLGGCGRLSLDLAAGGRSVYAPVDRLPDCVALSYSPSPEASEFEIHARASWIFWAVPLNHPRWERLLQPELAAEEAIANLRIEIRPRWDDTAVSLLTLGCYRSTHLVIRGDRVRLVPPSGPPMPHSPSSTEPGELAPDREL